MRDIKKIKLNMSEDKNLRIVQKQENFNTLRSIKSSENKFFLVESQIGIGTIYTLRLIFNSINDIFLDYSIDSSLSSSDANKKLVVVDINDSVETIDLEEVCEKMENLGFKKIILVTRLALNEPENRFSRIMVNQDNPLLPNYLEIIVNGNLTEAGVKRVKDYVLSNSNNDKKTKEELETFLNSLPDEQSLNSNPIVVFWNED